MLKRTLQKTYGDHYENQYLQLIRDIIEEGSIETGRNGKTCVVVGSSMYFSLENNVIPLLTTKKVAWKTCLRELLWFVRGQTNNKILTDQKCNIWKGNASREFLDSRGLTHLREDDLGPVYGHQWRHFNAKYTTCDEDYSGKGVDQLQNIIDLLKNPETRSSRRMVMSAWNPAQLDEMALPPCHVMSQFNVSSDDKLSCLLFQRSGDIGLGVPFNIASYAMLTHILATHCNLQPNKLIHVIGDAHIYEDHIESLKKQIVRPHYNMPEIFINKKDHIDDYEFDDIKIENYKYHPSIKMKMIA